jgi:isoleucyl-tRNA synthetase
MSEYKDTLNLPKTAFSMKANLANREPGILKKWQDNRLYETLREKRKGKEKFILHDGPPYANGALHCGHALNKILKDIVIKSKSLSGYDAPYVPGWDCHGLPIELNVEKKYGKAGTKLSKSEFRLKCREYAETQVTLQREQFMRFGVLGDWFNHYATMQFSYEANIIRALGEIIKNKHMVQGFKPVYWCLDCASSLAEAEVEYEDKSSPSIDVKFKAIDNSLFEKAFGVQLKGSNLYVPIWTTTPWTLPANQAVSLNEALDYALVHIKETSEHLILAAELVDAVMSRYDINDHEVIGSVKGQALEGLLLQHPFYDERQVPLILAEHVNLEAGTGCVHTAPAHGPDDYVVGLKYKLPLDNPVLGNGLFSEKAGVLSGQHVKKADGIILSLLEEKNVLIKKENIKHSYPHCWRHKTPIIFRATPQWFISMDKAGLREAALKEINQTDFIPDWGKARIHGMVEGRPDWCISRQRFWGTPIAVFIDKETGELHPETESLIEKVALMVEEKGIEGWFDLDTESFLGDEADKYQKVVDTLDVWFDAGVSHYSVLKQRDNLEWPADLYLEGSDQHRGWFNSSLVTSCALYEKAPYKKVLTHGFTVDENGIKLSKSKGNFIAPDKIINQSGADILRLWAASTDYKGEVHLSNEVIKRTADGYRRLRNTCRFLLANLFDFEPDKHQVPVSEMVALDKWAIKYTASLQEEIIDAFNAYDFHVVYQKIHHFCAIELGGFYLDIIKDRQYTAPKNSVARRSCQTAIFHIAEYLVRWLAPIVSFTADEIWDHLPGERQAAVFYETWYEKAPLIDDIDLSEWETFKLVRDEVNKAIERKRGAQELGSALEADVTLYVNDTLYATLQKATDELRFLLITSKAKICSLDEKEALAEKSDMDGLYISILVSKAEKCERCWHRLESVGEDSSHPSICKRCVGNISDKAEKRNFA